jgi:trimeric autotransporter adhesin
MKVIPAAASLILASGLCSGQLYLISTVAGGGPPPSPFAATSASISSLGVATDAAGNVYFTNANAVFKLDQNGSAALVAGSLVPGLKGDGGPAVTAQLNSPQSVAADAAGNLFIADSLNSRVRRISPDGIIATVAGGGAQTADGGPATSASIGVPIGVAIDGAGNLFIASGDGHVRKVAPSGIITTLAGAVELGCGPVTLSNLPNPGLAVDSDGNLLLAACARVVKVSPSGSITNVAGNGLPGFSGDGGPATTAQIGSDLLYPENMALDSAGNLFIGDVDNARVRKVSPGGIITTVAGTGVYGSSGDGGRAVGAQITVYGLATD